MRELGIHQHHLGHGLGGGRRIAHGDAEVRLLDGERVVDAVAGHGNHVVLRVQRLHDGPLLGGQHTSQHIDVLKHAGQLVHVLGQRAGVHRHRLAVAGEPDLAGDGADRHRIVAGDHTATHSLFAEPGQRPRGIRADPFRAQHKRHRPGLRLQPRPVGFTGLGGRGRLRGTAGVKRVVGTVVSGDQQYAVPVVGVVVDLPQHIGVIAVERGDDDFGRPHVPCLVPLTARGRRRSGVRAAHRAPFAR